MSKQHNIGYINNLRVFATFAVLMIHIISPIITYYSKSLTSYELYFSDTFRSIWYWAVPIFVMISGSLLLKPEKIISTKDILFKYVKRIIVILLIFGIPFAWLEIYFTTKEIHAFQLLTALRNVLTGNTWAHMWYLYMLIGLYLFTPIIKSFISLSSKETQLYTLFVLLLFTSIFPFIKFLSGFSFGISFPVNSVYVLYYVLGYYLSTYCTSPTKIFKALTLLAPISIILLKPFIFAPTFEYTSLFSYESPVIILLSLGIYINMMQSSSNNKIIEKLSFLCFGFYLIHPLFINIIYKVMHFTPDNQPLLLVIIISSLITAFLSLLTLSLLSKIKLFRTLIC